ncbi:MAG: hypothetical protein Q9219_001855 [cf. Caloplaca sp. 3 TL-2023]
MLQGSILIAAPHVAVAGTVDDLGFAAEQERMVYWTDASRRDDLRCGIGVVHQSSTESWDKLSWSVRASTETQVLEIYAIAKALELAGERCHAVEAEQRPSGVEQLVGPGMPAVEELSILNIPVELGWVPGHAGILGNQLTDRAAKKGANHSVGRRRAGLLMTVRGRNEGNGLQTDSMAQTPAPKHPMFQLTVLLKQITANPQPRAECSLSAHGIVKRTDIFDQRCH